MAKKSTTSRTGRFLKLAGMTVSVAGRYASGKVQRAFTNEELAEESKQRTYSKMAEDIVDTLGELKGAVMKVGQIASQTQDLLPKEFSQALQKLQKEAPPIEFSVIQAQIEQELGQTPWEAFKSFDVVPFAAASIGQVHRAVTKSGIPVIVKIQYPGVDKSVDSDLKQLRLTLKLGGLIKMPKASADALFEEIKARLKEELDYEQEAKNLRQFRQFHENHEGILIPKVINRLSTKRVLTLEYLEGDDLDAVKLNGYDQQTINLLGQRLFTMMSFQLFQFNKIHGDPHPGNFAFRKDGTLVVYDFGCVKTLKPEIVTAYGDAIRSSIEEDYEGVDDALLRLGARVNAKSSPGGEYYKIWRDIFFEPFSNIENYDYESSDVHVRAAKQTPLFFKHIDYFKPPVDSLYIDRMISGQYWIMKSLGVKANFRPHLDEYI